MNSITKAMWLLGALGTGGGPALSREVAGQVRDQVTGSPVSGATVIVAEVNDTAITDAQGRFYFPDIPEGEYTFLAGGAGFAPLVLAGTSVRASCCTGRAGDANGSGEDEPTIGDISAMIDARFLSTTCAGIIPCPAEADVNQTGGPSPGCEDITVGDISLLIDYLFITGPSLGLPDCL